MNKNKLIMIKTIFSRNICYISRVCSPFPFNVLSVYGKRKKLFTILICIFITLVTILELSFSENLSYKRTVIAINFTASFVVLDNYDKNDSVGNQPTLVYTCLGEHAFTKHQSYIWESLAQARLLGGSPLAIVVIMNKISDTDDVAIKMERLNVTIIIYEDLLNRSTVNSVLYSEFRKVFFVQGAMVPDENTHFNQLTTERLFAVHAYMSVWSKSDVFHMENDNMLYYDLTHLMHHMHTCRVYFGITKGAMYEVVFSFLYIRNIGVLEHFLRYTIEVFRLGKAKAVEYLRTEWINDMTIGGRYLEQFASKPETSRLNGIAQLPVDLKNTNCCLCVDTNSAEGIIFDARTLGQYFGGDFWYPNMSFWSRNALLDPRGKFLVWKMNEKRLRLPYFQGRRIVNLHIHSKNLERFSSLNNNPPTGREHNATRIVD